MKKKEIEWWDKKQVVETRTKASTVKRALTTSFTDCKSLCQNTMFWFAETWLPEDITVSLPGCTFIRFDRDTKKSGKLTGGGLCVAVNDRWTTNFTV